MNCEKKCDCSECEMLQHHIITFIDDLNPFNIKRIAINGFKCGYSGKCDVDVPSLRKAGFIDDIIYASKNKIAIDYIEIYSQ